MRPNNRQRSRGGRNGGGGGGGGGHHHKQQHHNPNRPPNRNQIFDSSGPDVRVRGNAHQVFDKYQALAREAASSGDRILAEAYWQYADHYFRMIQTMGGFVPAQQPGLGRWRRRGPEPAPQQQGQGWPASAGQRQRPRRGRATAGRVAKSGRERGQWRSRARSGRRRLPAERAQCADRQRCPAADDQPEIPEFTPQRAAAGAALKPGRRTRDLPR